MAGDSFTAAANAGTDTAGASSRRSKRSGGGIPCYDFFVNRSGTIDSATLRGMTPSMVSAHAVRAWKALSPNKRADIVQQAKEEELLGKTSSLQVVEAVSALASLDTSDRFSSAGVDIIEPMVVVHTVDDDAAVADVARDAAPPNPAEDDDMDVEVVVVDSDGNDVAGGGTTLEADDEINLERSLVDATAKVASADRELKALRELLKREKRKDEKAVKAAEAKRKKLHDTMRRIEMSIAMRTKLAAHRMGKNASPERKPAIRLDDNQKAAVSIGDYVEVAPDFSPYMKRHRGMGEVIAVRGVGGATLVDVRYAESYGKQVFRDIQLDYITSSSLPFNTGSVAEGRSKRDAPVREEDAGAAERPKKKQDARTPAEKIADELVEGHEKRLGKGWMRKRIGKDGGDKRLNVPERMIFFGQALALESYVAGRGGNRYADTYVKSGKFKARSNKFNPLTTKYLQHAWGCHKDFWGDLQRESVRNAVEQGAKPKDVEVQYSYCPKAPKAKSKSKSAIDDYATADRYYSAGRLYAIHKCREAKEDCFDTIEKEEDNEMLNMYLQEYNTLDDDKKSHWEFKRRNHLKRQPHIKHEIVASISKNPQQSYRAIERDIGHWTSSKTIERWLKSFDSYEFYKERIVPLLSEAQKGKHFTFAKYVLKLWGLKDESGNLPNGKKRILLIHYDEKWFWGLVLRAFAKACEELGIEKRDYAAFHKSHINKVMAIAFVGAVFTDTLENGCEIVKLPMVRAQAYKIAERVQYPGVKQPDGSMKYPKKDADGNDIEPERKKGESYAVDCCVTGSNEGTKKDPKCPLLLVFKHVIFPEIEKLVGPGGKYEDCHVVLQGDQAGPHEDTTFRDYVERHCKAKGWTWAPQAPQMPHGNVLDLSVFPAMSRRHQEAARKMSGCRVLSRDDIWKTAQDCWDAMPECAIGRAFVQYWRTMSKVIEERGGNSFVGRNGNGLHSGIRLEFDDTKLGVKPSFRHPSNQ